MKKHILCFGDSNTHGYCADPADCADSGVRFAEEQRWTQLLQEALGQDYLVIEEGLSGRTTCFDDPIHEGLNGLDYIYPCLKSHEAIDLLIIMLGTNVCKDRFYARAACIGLGMARLVNKAKSTDCWGGKTPNILVIAPPPIGEGMLTSPVAATMGQLCVEKSRQLADSYREQCELLNVSFLDAGAIGCEFNTVDFMHLTSRGHRTLAEALTKLIPQLLR